MKMQLNVLDKSVATDTTSQKIGVIVIGQDGNEVFFKISRFMQLKKLITSYCERQSLNMDSVAFLFGDHFLRWDLTPNEVGMNEGDKIYTFYAKSLKRDKKGGVTEKHRDNGHHAQENSDSYTSGELVMRTTQRFGQRDLDAKLVDEKQVAEKDIIIARMHDELQEASDAISHFSKKQYRLTEQLSKFKKELVNPADPVQSIRKERWDSKRVSVSGSQSQRKKSRLHDPIPVHQPLFEQGNSKDVEQSRKSDEDEDKKSDGGLQNICIKVQRETRESLFFKIRQNTRLGKVMRAYCKRQGEKDYDSLCFVVHGKIQRDDTTLYELQLKDGDELQAVRKSSNV